MTKSEELALEIGKALWLENEADSADGAARIIEPKVRCLFDWNAAHFRRIEAYRLVALIAQEYPMSSKLQVAVRLAEESEAPQPTTEGAPASEGRCVCRHYREAHAKTMKKACCFVRGCACKDFTPPAPAPVEAPRGEAVWCEHGAGICPYGCGVAR